MSVSVTFKTTEQKVSFTGHLIGAGIYKPIQFQTILLNDIHVTFSEEFELLAY